MLIKTLVPLMTDRPGIFVGCIVEWDDADAASLISAGYAEAVTPPAPETPEAPPVETPETPVAPIETADAPAAPETGTLPNPTKKKK